MTFEPVDDDDVVEDVVRDGVTLFVERPLITLRVEDPILEDALLFLYVLPMKAPVCVVYFLGKVKVMW